MPTKRTGEQLLNPKGLKVWHEDGPTRGQYLWEMHGVWEWDSAKNAGAVLREKYFVSDAATGRKVRCSYSTLIGSTMERAALTITTGSLVFGFLLPVTEELPFSLLPSGILSSSTL
jgi:hypothetical protein